MEKTEGRSEAGSDPLSLNENAGHIPNSQNGLGSTRKRVYQTRRNTRACDACRSRKTKCDAAGARAYGPCTSCASASIICKFGELGNCEKRIGPVRRLRMLETTIGELTEKLKEAEAKLQSPSNSSYFETSHSTCSQSPRHSIPLVRRRSSSNSSISECSPPSTTSTLGFMESVQGYMDGLGYDTSLLDMHGANGGKTQSTSPSSDGDSFEIKDLRALLPTKENGEKLLAIFHEYIIRYMPAMCWSVIQNKFKRGYDAPVSIDDRSSVTGIFCVLMAINAYSSVCTNDSDIFEVPNYSSKRGWYFLEFAKNFHDLHRPTYSLFDAEVFVLMAIYLEVVALPYPLRLTLEYLVKVCKELKLHRNQSNLGPIEREHRSRIFWSMFLLDRKLALQFGTVPTFDDEEIDVDEPGHNDISDLVDVESRETGLARSSSAALMRSLIAIARLIGPVSRMNGRAENFTNYLNGVEQKLSGIENSFPQGILAWGNFTPLDPVLLDAALLAMATRISLYRHFTDATLGSAIRTRCFIQSLEVAKVTVHLLRRMMKFQNWEASFSQRQCGLAYQHIFKISTILLLAAAISPKPFDTRAELKVCIEVLKVAASVRPIVFQNLRTLEKIAEVLTQKPTMELFGSLIKSTHELPPPQVIGNIIGYHSDSVCFPGSAPPITATSSMIPTTIPYSAVWPQPALALLTSDVFVDPNGSSALGPGYRFPNLAESIPPVETHAWLNQVDPSSWAIMQSVI